VRGEAVALLLADDREDALTAPLAVNDPHAVGRALADGHTEVLPQEEGVGDGDVLVRGESEESAEALSALTLALVVDRGEMDRMAVPETAVETDDDDVTDTL